MWSNYVLFPFAFNWYVQYKYLNCPTWQTSNKLTFLPFDFLYDWLNFF